MAAEALGWYTQGGALADSHSALGCDGTPLQGFQFAASQAVGILLARAQAAIERFVLRNDDFRGKMFSGANLGGEAHCDATVAVMD